MQQDKYSAVWVSHSSIKDFLKCPRAYYLKNVYKDPKTGHKMQLMSPSMALGQAVHEVIESLSMLPVENRFKGSLFDKFENAWQKVAGKKGGFPDRQTEGLYQKRGEEMLRRLIKNPGPLAQKAVKIREELPYYWLSDEDNIILCGKIDWIEYLPDTNSIHIIDFKTSKNQEDPNSLQLPIYYLLASNTQKRHIEKISYWYLELSDSVEEKSLPDLKDSQEEILKIAKQIKIARQFNRFKSSNGNGCSACKPMESVILGNAEFVGVNEFKQDTYVIGSSINDGQDDLIH